MPQDQAGFSIAAIPVIQNRSLFRKLVRRLLNLTRINYRQALMPGPAFFGTNFFIDVRPGVHKFRSTYALEYVLRLKPGSVLDVGSGGGYHAQAFRDNGNSVTCIDYGTSIYARQTTAGDVGVIHQDFNAYQPKQKFGLVWASHILEHQRNSGMFLEKLIACCSEDGHVCITLPDPHRKLWGGHLSLWTPALLAYNVVLCGVNISDAVFVRGTDEFSLIFRPHRIKLPENLTYDSGDVDLLASYLPKGVVENCDPWSVTFERPKET
jgi:2-polyprenyl-3-methyl-5-hydroxy-6-metoxy-1,4-benzoquinol methylase